MAKQNSVNLDITNNADGFDVSGGTTSRKLTVSGADIAITGSGTSTVTFPSTSTTLAGLGITQSFTALQTFTTGISASGSATFANNVTFSSTTSYTGLATFLGGITASGGTFSGQLNAKNLKMMSIGGDEGGQIDFDLPTGSSLSGNVAFDIYQNRVRIFETTGANRGVYIDLAGVSAGVGTNLVGGGGGAVSSVSGSGNGISVSPTTGAVVVQNTGVHSFNGLTGAIQGVTSVNGLTGAVTNIAVTNTAQSFTGVQRFPTGITTSGITLTDGTYTATLKPTTSTYTGSLVFDVPSADFISNAGTVGFGDINLLTNQTKMYLDDSLRRFYINTASGQNVNFNINRVTNTTSALFVSHTTGKNVRLAYNHATGTVTNYTDLDTTSTGDFLITPSGNDTTIAGNLHITGSGGLTAAGITSAAYAISSAGINALTGVTYTFLASDNGKVLTHNNSGGATLTVPSGLPVGFSVTIIHIGTGNLGITSASGVTLNSWTSKYRSVGQHNTMGLLSYSSNIFNLSGGLTG